MDPTGHVSASWRPCQASCERGVAADVTPAVPDFPSPSAAAVVGRLHQSALARRGQCTSTAWRRPSSVPDSTPALSAASPCRDGGTHHSSRRAGCLAQPPPGLPRRAETGQ
jgi:hypothetical protein